jgi:hypothetical protein
MTFFLFFSSFFLHYPSTGFYFKLCILQRILHSSGVQDCFYRNERFHIIGDQFKVKLKLWKP